MPTLFDGIPGRIAKERERLKIGVKEFAEIGGVSFTTQYRLEKSCTTLNVDYLEKLAAVGVDVFYVVTGVRADQFGTPVPEELQPVVDALVNLWLSRTLTVETLDSWRMMFDRLNPFVNLEAAKEVKPSSFVSSDPEDHQLLSRKPGK